MGARRCAPRTANLVYRTLVTLPRSMTKALDDSAETDESTIAIRAIRAASFPYLGAWPGAMLLSSARSASITTGLVMWWSKPASLARVRSLSAP